MFEDITKNIINNYDVYYENYNNKNINKKTNLINNNNIFMKNMNFINDINNLVSLGQVYFNNDNSSNFLNNVLLQNISCNNIYIF